MRHFTVHRHHFRLGDDGSLFKPSAGGQLVLYSSPPLTDASKRLVFVNGVLNTPGDFAEACRNLCELTGCEVLGVYNQTGNEPTSPAHLKLPDDVAFDLGQSASDMAGLAIRAVLGKVGLDPIWLGNGCARSLLHLLMYEGPKWPNLPNKRLCIVAHSQGNLITSNALMVYSKLVRKHRKLALHNRATRPIHYPDIHVIAIASPAFSWPTNDFISVEPYWHRCDPVAAFSIWRNTRACNKGQGLELTERDPFKQHRLVQYLDNGSGDRPIVDAICKQMQTKVPQ